MADRKWPADAEGARKALQDKAWLADVLSADTRLMDDLLVYLDTFDSVVGKQSDRPLNPALCAYILLCALRAGNGAFDAGGNARV